MDRGGITPLRIVIIGGGNVATHLTRALINAGVTIAAVAPAERQSVRELAAKHSLPTIERVGDIPTDVDAVIIATNDRATAEVAAQLPPVRGVVMHTSGSVPLSSLTAHHQHAGVLYPLQTFSKDVPVDVRQVPFFIEASDADTEAFIRRVAALISDHVYAADSRQRRYLHVAGVLTSNFPIYLMEVAQRTLAEAGFPLEVVSPLMKASVAKAFAVGPHDALTGPARRGDVATIAAHQAMLPPADSEIYRVISNAILNEYHTDK